MVEIMPLSSFDNKQLIRFRICSRNRAVKESYRNIYSPIISITDPLSNKPKFANHYNRRKIELRFYDEDDSMQPDGPKPQHCKQILEFAESVGHSATDWIVHCEAGVCRSSAAAIACSWLLNGEAETMAFFESKRTHICPNMLMAYYFDKQLGALGKLLSYADDLGKSYAESATHMTSNMIWLPPPEET